jgi:hypothetical protein
MQHKNSKTFKIKTVSEKTADSSFTNSDKGIKKLLIDNFDKYDCSKDDNLDLTELTEFFEDILQRKNLTSRYNAEHLAKKFIAMIDLDGDGKISR